MIMNNTKKQEEMIKQINDKTRFSALLSSHIINFILAEEIFLIQMGWILVKIDRKMSYWTYHQLSDTYSRNQAILIEKSTNKNIGLY